jgi:hypothetical protein
VYVASGWPYSRLRTSTTDLEVHSVAFAALPPVPVERLSLLWASRSKVDAVGSRALWRAAHRRVQTPLSETYGPRPRRSRLPKKRESSALRTGDLQVTAVATLRDRRVLRRRLRAIPALPPKPIPDRMPTEHLQSLERTFCLPRLLSANRSICLSALATAPDLHRLPPACA